MQLTHTRRAPWLALLMAAFLAAVALLPAAASAASARPQLLSPKKGATLAINSQPTFKVKDLGRPYANALYMAIARSARKDRFGRLADYEDGGTFTKMTAAPKKRWTYVPPRYVHAEWFMNHPGTWYWQAYHINSRGDLVFSKVGKFKVG